MCVVGEQVGCTRVQRLNRHMKSPLVMHFLEYSLCKLVFQASLAMLPSLKVEVLRLLRILLGICSLWGSPNYTHEGINEMNLNDPALQLVDNELGIGHEACQKKRTTLIVVY